MDIQMLREFVHFTVSLNFSETAMVYFISQSTLSKHIQHLERSLGVRLLSRTKHSTKVTEEGVKFCEYARKIISFYDAAYNELHHSDQNISGTLRIGFLNTAVQNIFSQALTEFQTSFPNVELRLSSHQYGELEQLLAKCEIDLAIMLRFPGYGLLPEFSYKDIYQDRCGCVMSENSPLYGRDMVSFSDILDKPFIAPIKYKFPTYTKIIETWEKRYGKIQNVVQHYSSIETMLPIVASSSIISIIPSHVACYNHSYTLRFIPFDGAEFDVFVIAVWHTKNSAQGVSQFADILVANQYQAKQCSLPNERQ
jgi:DNA-binding transcriptional LysR family regulator